MDAMTTRTHEFHSIGGCVVPLPGVAPYALSDTSRLLTPALLVYPELVASNVRTVIDLLDGRPLRWRAHVKSAKLSSVIAQLVGAGVTHLKSATTLELRAACEAGARDVLLAYPVVGPKVERVKALARLYPTVSISALVEDPAAVAPWKGSEVGLFVDVNPGMDRTGVPDAEVDAIIAAARAVMDADVRFGGVHYYDGHLSSLSPEHGEQAAHAGYDRLLEIVGKMERAGLLVPEIVTAGTPAFPFTLSYRGFSEEALRAADGDNRPGVVHRASPGTIVYNDATSLGYLPADWDLRPAAVVAATVVSHPAPGRITCDAGHKTVSADAGVPTCAILGRPDLQPLKPSEEHLPIAVPAGSPMPAIGEILYLVPRHVCPTVNNFDEAVIVRRNRIDAVERVAARGRETPVF